MGEERFNTLVYLLEERIAEEECVGEVRAGDEHRGRVYI